MCPAKLGFPTALARSCRGLRPSQQPLIRAKMRSSRTAMACLLLLGAALANTAAAGAPAVNVTLFGEALCPYT